MCYILVTEAADDIDVLLDEPNLDVRFRHTDRFRIVFNSAERVNQRLVDVSLLWIIYNPI